MDNRAGKLAWVAAAVGLLLLVSATILARRCGVAVLAASAVGGGVVCLVSLVAGGRVRLARRQAEEEEATRRYREEHGTSELFAGADEAVKLAARANRSYVRYFVPVFTVLLGLGTGLPAVLLWQHWNSPLGAPQPGADLLRYAVLVIGLTVVCLLGGSYSVGISREPGCRWLRPGGAWLFFTGALLGVGFLVLVGMHFKVNIPQLDLRVAKVLMSLLVLLAVETVLNFVVEFYRPRSVGEEERPQFESRLLALFTEPGGIARNVATSLDYQFGFQVSEVWFYRFLERTVMPFAIVMAVAFWLMTCIVVIKTEESGILERFGRVVTPKPLGPGLYVKLPWPMASMFTFPVERVQEIPVGYTPGDGGRPDEHSDVPQDMGDPTGRVVLWSKSHAKDELHFVVASSSAADAEATGGTERGQALPVNVYFMAAAIPLYFRVSDLYQYAYAHRDPRKVLEEVATREVVRYLANVDFAAILTAGRAAGAEELRRRIQEAADGLKLGVEIVFVGLQGLHPPVTVGKAFDEVVAAMEERHETVLKAERYAVQAELGAEAVGLMLKGEAKAYREDRIRVPKAEAERFAQQRLAYHVAPDLFRLRTFLDVLEGEGAHARKYIVVGDAAREVITLDLQEKIRPDLLDLELKSDEEPETK